MTLGVKISTYEYAAGYRYSVYITGHIRKHSSVISAKKERKTIEWETLEIYSRKLDILREYFMQE